jgi:hypothetical protein
MAGQLPRGVHQGPGEGCGGHAAAGRSRVGARRTGLGTHLRCYHVMALAVTGLCGSAPERHHGKVVFAGRSERHSDKRRSLWVLSFC